MSRRFDGVDDQVQWAIGGASLTGAWTFACVIKLDTGVSWQSFLSNDITATGSEIAQGRSGSSGQLAVFRGGGAGGIADSISISSTDGWMLVASTRPAGVGQTVRNHKVIISSAAATHTDAETHPNVSAQQSIVFGQIDGSDFFDGWLAVAAEWNTALSDGDVESLVTTFTRANWLSLSPVALWDEIDAFATDHAGTSTRTSITGTTDDADDPTGWASWAGAAATPIPSLVMPTMIPA